MDFKTGGQQVILRLVEAYGFTTRQMLCEHLGVSKSTLATRFMRDIFPAEWVIQCALETKVSLKWLTTGQGKMFEDNSSDLIDIPRKKIIDGIVYEANNVKLDSVLLTRTLNSPVFIIDGNKNYIAEYNFETIEDGIWIIKIDNRISIRKVTLLPGERIKVLTTNDYFECFVKDISFIGKIIYNIEEM